MIEIGLGNSSQEYIIASCSYSYSLLLLQYSILDLFAELPSNGAPPSHYRSHTQSLLHEALWHDVARARVGAPADEATSEARAVGPRTREEVDTSEEGLPHAGYLLHGIDQPRQVLGLAHLVACRPLLRHLGSRHGRCSAQRTVWTGIRIGGRGRALWHSPAGRRPREMRTARRRAPRRVPRLNPELQRGELRRGVGVEVGGHAEDIRRGVAAERRDRRRHVPEREREPREL